MSERLEKRKPITRTLIARTTTGESTLFPLAAQIARLRRQRTDQGLESVCLITSRPEKELSAEQWLEKNIPKKSFQLDSGSKKYLSLGH